MSGLRSSFTRKWPVTGMPSPMLKSNQNIIANKTPLWLLLVGQYPSFRTSRGMCLLVVGEYKLYHSIWEPPIMYVAWKIPRSFSCYVDNEAYRSKYYLSLFQNLSSSTSANPCFPLRRAHLCTFIVESSYSYKRHQLESTTVICMQCY